MAKTPASFSLEARKIAWRLISDGPSFMLK